MHFFLDGCVPEIRSDKWSVSLGKSDLRATIEDIIGNICTFQNDRDQTFAVYFKEKVTAFLDNIKAYINKKNPFYYDPMNLFFEEFKVWLRELSKAPLNSNTSVIVQKRINYLNQIYCNAKIFKQANFLLNPDSLRQIIKCLTLKTHQG